MEFASQASKGPKRMLIGGNWKCNGTNKEAEAIYEFINNMDSIPASSEVVIGVPMLHVKDAMKKFRSEIAVAAQDCGVNPGYGAYTGEISPSLLVDSGVKWTIVGHSERRAGFVIPGETNELVGQKAAAALSTGLSVIACIGEQLSDRESGKTMEVCSKQLAAIASCLDIASWNKVVIAYEPVWAIGTGKVATPEQAEETHSAIRAWIATNVSEDVARDVRIIYGGSVKGSNCGELIHCPNIDGFLVGGASLKPEFVDIIKCTV